MCRHVVVDESIFPYHVISQTPTVKSTKGTSTNSYTFGMPSLSGLSSDQQVHVVTHFSQPSTDSSVESAARGNGSRNESGNNGRGNDFVENPDIGNSAEKFENHDSENHDIDNNFGSAENSFENPDVGDGLNLVQYSLPHELSFVKDESQSYNNHSMLTKANNGTVKKKTFEDFLCLFMYSSSE